jgi:hypothetical protein
MDIIRKLVKDDNVGIECHDRPPNQMPPKSFSTVQDPARSGREEVIMPP